MMYPPAGVSINLFKQAMRRKEHEKSSISYPDVSSGAGAGNNGFCGRRKHSDKPGKSGNRCGGKV